MQGFIRLLTYLEEPMEEDGRVNWKVVLGIASCITVAAARAAYPIDLGLLKVLLALSLLWTVYAVVDMIFPSRTGEEK